MHQWCPIDGGLQEVAHKSPLDEPARHTTLHMIHNTLVLDTYRFFNDRLFFFICFCFHDSKITYYQGMMITPV